MSPLEAQSPYVLVTAARNEEEHIERALRSVEAQTLLPERWVIVSDGSSDGTDAIVSRHAREHPFIHHVRIEDRGGRDFGGKVRAIQRGVAEVSDLRYDFIGVLDADVSFGPEYYAAAVARLSSEPDLGLVGGVRFDDCGGTFREVIIAESSAGGPSQFFRRTCYEAIGGYLALPGGGEDACAEITARMKGWGVRTLPELLLWHHRRTGTHTSNILMARFHQGMVEHSLGYHPVFELARCAFRVVEPPYLAGSCFRLAGYCLGAFRRQARAVPGEVVSYLRAEQMSRLKNEMVYLLVGRKGQAKLPVPEHE